MPAMDSSAIVRNSASKLERTEEAFESVTIFKDSELMIARDGTTLMVDFFKVDEDEEWVWYVTEGV